ncbi:hypothetical protein HGM15179_000990, partial [Zosterops borbonicus]
GLRGTERGRGKPWEGKKWALPGSPPLCMLTERPSVTTEKFTGDEKSSAPEQRRKRKSE